MEATEANEQGVEQHDDQVHDVEHDHGGKREVVVTYNGVDKDIKYKRHEEAKVLLEAAMDAFDVRENRHTMALWTEAGELPIEGTVEEAGILPGMLLVLRPSAVRGG
jgi:hypothetical protein